MSDAEQQLLDLGLEPTPRVHRPNTRSKNFKSNSSSWKGRVRIVPQKKVRMAVSRPKAIVSKTVLGHDSDKDPDTVSLEQEKDLLQAEIRRLKDQKEVETLRQQLSELKMENDKVQKSATNTSGGREKDALSMPNLRRMASGFPWSQPEGPSRTTAATPMPCDIPTDMSTKTGQPQTAIQVLDGEVDNSIRSALAEGTRRNLTSQLKGYFLFCQYFGLLPVPASVQTVCRFLQFLTRSVTSLGTLYNYLHAIRSLHRIQGLQPVAGDHFFVKLMLKGLSRHSLQPTSQKLPITPSMLLQFYKLLDMASPKDVTLWAAILLGFFSFFRKSNLVPKSIQDFDPSKHLCRGKISVSDFGLVVGVTWSKTIQFRERCLTIPIACIPGSVLCPKHAFNHMCDLIPAAPSSPAFVFPESGTLVPLTHAGLVRGLKQLVKKCGYPDGMYSGHSLRRGGASYAFSCNVPGELIKLQGDWQSDAYLRYLSIPFETRYLVTFQMSQGIHSNSC
ncbi:integrase/recombinase xerD homolog [Glandiceps talaboti]